MAAAGRKISWGMAGTVPMAARMPATGSHPRGSENCPPICPERSRLSATRVADALHATAWFSKPDDQEPWLRIDLAEPVRADLVRLYPGDSCLATWGTHDHATRVAVKINGSGDGFLDGNWMATANTETANFWKHLRASGLIDGGADDETQPTHAYGGTIGIRDGSLNLAGTTAVFASLEGPVMRIIEDRHDDGSPASGRIQSELTAVQMDGNTASTAGSTYSDDARYFVAFRL